MHDSVTKKLENITLNQDLAAALALNGETPSGNDIDTIMMMLYVKDRFSISGRAYIP